LKYYLKMQRRQLICLLSRFGQLQEQIGPLKAKIRVKEGEKQRLRSAGNEEERNLQVQVSQFDNDAKQLRDLVNQIDTYAASSKADELENLSETIAKLLGRIDDRKERITELQPELESARNAVLDQERHKKNLKQNVDILEANIRMKDLQKEIAKLEQQRDAIEGYESVYDDMLSVKSSKEKLQEDKARLDGRFSEIAESIRSLKVSNEYVFS
jgi:DNA repair protein RAD50